MSQKKVKVKPGKTQSKAGFAVGLVFVAIGFFVIIPTFGSFGFIWTAVAGVITFLHFVNGFSDKGVPTHEIVFEDDMDMVQSSDDGGDIEAKLMKLNSLYEQCLITKEEYDEKRKTLLEEF